MNLEVHVIKSNTETNPALTIKFGDTTQTHDIYTGKQKIKLKVKHDCDTKLVIERNEESLYLTDQSHHANNLIVDKIVLDDFWEFGQDFYPPKSKLNQQYMEHLSKFNDCEWIKNTLGHNTHLFFNGSLTWDIKFPVRRSFFKDFKR